MHYASETGYSMQPLETCCTRRNASRKAACLRSGHKRILPLALLLRALRLASIGLRDTRSQGRRRTLRSPRRRCCCCTRAWLPRRLGALGLHMYHPVF